jgi:peptidoglycan-N-acetylglucosamine deacetylase
VKAKKKTAYMFPLVTVAILCILSYVLYGISKSRTFQFFGEIIPRVETDEKVVALTFDDAPTPYSDSVVKTLHDKNVHATFFVIGSNLEKYPEKGKALVTAGHELGNHSYSHKRFLLKPQGFIDKEIQTTNQRIRDAGYTGNIYFRPPNGKKLLGLPWYLQQHNIKTIMWDVEPDTYVPEELQGSARTDFLVNYTLENTKPGSIILMHPFCESCSSDREAVGKIIDGLKKQGYTFVTVSELLTYQKH